MSGDKHPKNAPLSEEDLRQALNESGYPLEVRLYNELKTRGIHPM